MSLSLRLVKRPIGLVAKAPMTQLRLYSGLPSRWLSDVQRDLRELTSDKYPSECRAEAGKLFHDNVRSWRQLLAGSQGFLLGHVNNVIYNRYVETGRVYFIRKHGEEAPPEEKPHWDDLPTPRSLGLILKSITTEYKFPLEFPDMITVLYKLREAPTSESSSLKMEALVLSEKHRRVAARCIDETTIYDYTTRKKSVLKPFMVEKFQETFKKQEEYRVKQTYRARQVVAAAQELKNKFQPSSESS
ncbi:hypothetical protein F53441_6795 [Fusarium austroafricanum]|uniref:Uncharacterized protein n=1 Tax=Fusarium austroafricanum TaxID=2364996 RepID=A0A8H4KHQ7_9HYPO|nr:hypothetical protein F53441_6795 [Fusarium austroafricanum]